MFKNIALDANTLVAISTGILALATFLVAWQTRRAAQATERTIEAQYTPWILMYAKPSWRGSLILLVVENVGRGPAYDITFDLPEYLPYNAHGIEEKDAPIPNNWTEGVLRNGMSFLAPGQQWRAIWGQYGGLIKGLNNKPLEVNINFKTINDIPRKTRCVLDIRDFEKYLLNNFEGSAVDALESQNKKLEAICTSLKSIASQKNKT